MDAEDSKTGRDGPVEERRFLQVADAVNVKRHPVVAKEYLACRFRVDGIGIVQKRRGKERRTVDDEPEEKKHGEIDQRAGIGVVFKRHRAAVRKQCRRKLTGPRGSHKNDD